MNEQAKFLEESGIDHLYVAVPREDVEAGDLTYTLGMLQPLIESPVLVRRFENQVSILFDGYNDDPREVFDIPEVRRFMTSLESAFPYFLWFFCTHDATLRVAAYSLCDLVSRKGATAIMHVQLDHVQLAAFMSRQFHVLNYMADRFHIDDAALEAVANRARAHFGYGDR